MRPLPWRDKFIKSCFLSVEFDIKYNNILGDTNGNYVSVDLKSVLAVTSIDCWSKGSDLKGGRTAVIASENQTGELDESANGWPTKPLPWRDKFIKSCFLAFKSIMKFRSTVGVMPGNKVTVNLITAWGLEVAGPTLFSVVIKQIAFIFTKQWKRFDVTSENKMAVWMGNKEARREIRRWCDFSDYFSSELQFNRTVRDVVVLLPYSRYNLEIMASSRGVISRRLLLQEPSLETIMLYWRFEWLLNFVKVSGLSCEYGGCILSGSITNFQGLANCQGLSYIVPGQILAMSHSAPWLLKLICCCFMTVISEPVYIGNSKMSVQLMTNAKLPPNYNGPFQILSQIVEAFVEVPVWLDVGPTTSEAAAANPTKYLQSSHIQ